MSTATYILPDPVERFNALGAALQPGGRMLEASWLRFAAYAALLVPGAPEEVAHSIQSKAKILSQHTSWYKALASPLRFAVAASLVESDSMVRRFESHMAELKLLLASEHLHPGEGVLAVLSAIHAILGDGHQVSALRVARVALLEREGRPHAWWRIGCADLPLCLVLSYLDGTVQQLTQAAESIQRRLAELTIGDAQARRSAARILLLGEGGGDACMRRYEALVDAYRERFHGVGSVICEVLASLSSLDHDAHAVLDACADTSARLQPGDSPLLPESREVLAGDLAFVSLVRIDRGGRPNATPERREAMFRQLRRHYAISLILACDAMIETPALSALNQPYPFPALEIGL